MKNDEAKATPTKQPQHKAAPRRNAHGLPLNRPIITWPLYEDTVPDWLKEQIVKDRLASQDDPTPTATDSEALAYLMGVSLAMPLGHSWSQVYLYCFTKTMAAAGKNLPEDLRNDRIDLQEQHMLQMLKDWIRKKQKIRHCPAHRNNRNQETMDSQKPANEKENR